MNTVHLIRGGILALANSGMKPQLFRGCQNTKVAKCDRQIEKMAGWSPAAYLSLVSTSTCSNMIPSQAQRWKQCRAPPKRSRGEGSFYPRRDQRQMKRAWLPPPVVFRSLYQTSILEANLHSINLLIMLRFRFNLAPRHQGSGNRQLPPTADDSVDLAGEAMADASPGRHEPEEVQKIKSFC